MLPPPILLVEHLQARLRTRRCAVPGASVERATELRLAGDWAGACDAAGIDADPDLPLRARAEVAGAVTEDLRHLAPDLVRWHLFRPRPRPSQVAPRDPAVLASYPLRGGYGRVRLLVSPPGEGRAGRLRLSLDMRGVADDWRAERGLARMYWDVRATDELRLWCGDRSRTGFFHPDGSPLSAGALPATPDDPDPLRRLEWATLRWDEGDVDAAAATYGLGTVEPRATWNGYPVALDRTAEKAHDWWETAPGSVALDLTREADWAAMEVRRGSGGPALASYREEKTGRVVGAGPAVWQRLTDWDLVRFGLLRPEELHPLVHQALFPRAAPVEPHTWRPDLSPVTVECSGQRHEIRMEGGRLRFVHDDADLDREVTLAAMGGRMEGCASARSAWSGTGGTLPDGLRAWRDHPFDLAFHGNVEGLEALLDAGFDPLVRAEDGRTLAEHLRHLPGPDRDRLTARLRR